MHKILRILSILSLFNVNSLSAPPAQPDPGAQFRKKLWGSIAPTYRAILEHPFLRELQTGKLRRESFQYYLIQDLHYLRAFSRALELAADRAPRPEWAAILRRHARESTESEKKMHDSILRDYGVTPEQINSTKLSPTNVAYTNFMLATACSRPFSEVVAALAPCYWIYLEVGKELKKKGSRERAYRLWIDTYAASGYEKDVEDFLAIVDAAAQAAGVDGRARMLEHFERGSRYEWMFWDMAYRMESWPP